MAQPGSSEFDLPNFIITHVKNSPHWHPPLLPEIYLPLNLSVHGLMLIIAGLLLIGGFCLLYRRQQIVPRGFTNLLETLVLFIRDDIAVANLGKEEGRKMAPLFCTFFFFILTLNLIGIIPLFSTATANINVTAALSLVTFAFMTIGAIARNGVSGFFSAFFNPEIPIAMRIALFPLEFLGLFIKTFALTVRLFANMLAGHMVIFALIGLIGLLGLAASPIIILSVFITLLEIAVAFLQAYIFTLLSAIFIGQIYHPQH